MTKDVKSPCISVCYINDDGFCQGCFRTGDEISQWTRYNNSQKRQVVIASDKRRKEAGWVL